MSSNKIDLNGKICLITGANAGIGKETAIKIAKMGAHIVMVCRNEERGRNAQEEIKRESENEHVDLLIADLASLSSVRKVAEDFKKNYENLHILINNAGVFNRKRVITEDGYESTFAVDYLAHFLLTILLLDILKKSAPARILNVSSNIHLYFKVNFEDLMSEKKYASQKAYANAKGAQVMFTFELARKLEGTGVTVNALHPGHAKTKIMMPTRKISKFLIKIFIPTMKSPKEAAKTSIYLASSPEVEGISGKYFSKCKERKAQKMTYDISLQNKLWENSEKLVNQLHIP